MKHVITTAALVGLVACGSEKSASKTEPAATVEAEDVLAPRDAEAPAARPDHLETHMRAHFDMVRRMERAVVGGRLEAVKEEAQKLVEHRPHPAEKSWEPELVELRTLAARVANASAVPEAAAAVASLGAACADCHTTMSAIVSFEWSEAPPASDDRAALMRRHLWASDRLWEGIVGPSEDSWNRGAAIFGEKSFSASLAGENRRAAELAKRVRELGGRAASATASERPGLYGELLSACSGCHAALGADKAAETATTTP